jgi:hypothetical protein
MTRTYIRLSSFSTPMPRYPMVFGIRNVFGGVEMAGRQNVRIFERG